MGDATLSFENSDPLQLARFDAEVLEQAPPIAQQDRDQVDLDVESRGGRGVLLGARARGATSTLFRHHFHLLIDGTKTGAPPPRQPKRLLQPYPGHMHMRGGVAHGHVRLIQQRLNAIAGRGGHDVLGGKLLQATGTFGPNTERIVKTFQGHRGMEEDGIVGPLTWARLFRR